MPQTPQQTSLSFLASLAKDPRADRPMDASDIDALIATLEQVKASISGNLGTKDADQLLNAGLSPALGFMRQLLGDKHPWLRDLPAGTKHTAKKSREAAEESAPAPTPSKDSTPQGKNEPSRRAFLKLMAGVGVAMGMNPAAAIERFAPAILSGSLKEVLKSIPAQIGEKLEDKLYLKDPTGEGNDYPICNLFGQLRHAMTQGSQDDGRPAWMKLAASPVTDKMLQDNIGSFYWGSPEALQEATQKLTSGLPVFRGIYAKAIDAMIGMLKQMKKQGGARDGSNNLGEWLKVTHEVTDRCSDLFDQQGMIDFISKNRNRYEQLYDSLALQEAILFDDGLNPQNWPRFKIAKAGSADYLEYQERFGHIFKHFSWLAQNLRDRGKLSAAQFAELEAVETQIAGYAEAFGIKYKKSQKGPKQARHADTVSDSEFITHHGHGARVLYERQKAQPGVPFGDL